MDNNFPFKSIEKCYKKEFEGYCFVIMANGNLYKRKVYERKTGKFADKCLVNFKTNVYSFTWKALDNNKTVADGINFEGSYKEVQQFIDEEDNKVKPVVQMEPPKATYDGEVFHYKFGMIKTCVENNIPVYLAGPAGSGKNHTLEQVAKALNLDFYFTNSVQQEFKLTGFIDAGGTYNETEFYRAFTKGGLFFLDEMDASIPEVLVLLNAAIANGYFEFPNGKVNCHPDFRVVAAGNTVGSGADEKYTGRLVLDQATLDRFAIIEFGYDYNVELAMAKGNVFLVNFIEQLRKRSEQANMRATFSCRCITMVRKLEDAGMPLKDILVIAVVKGMSKDEINTLKNLPLNTPGKTSITEDNKYYKALQLVG